MANAAEIRAIASGRYHIERLLGVGSCKRVYLAHDTRLDRPVALALIKTEGLDATALARVRREAQAMGRLGDHPHIVTVHDLGEEQGQPYIVSQYMAGGSVEEALRATRSRVPGIEGSTAERESDSDSPGTLPLEETLRIADHICRALEHAHARGVIHRDLKPANVWLTEDGTAKLGDFGLALERDRSRVTVEGMMVGTVAYMAPEQALGKPVDVYTDLYALGALLYELVTGRPPFVGDDAIAVVSQHLHTEPMAPSWHNVAVPPALEQLILALLAKAPDQRPASAALVRETLEHLRNEVGRLTTAAESDAAQSSALALQPELPSTANPLDRLDAGVFVGREQEMIVLRAAVEDAIEGRGRVALIAGEPGIGKTRVAQELATYAQLRGMQVLWARCHEGGGAPAYWPWVQAIRTYVYERTPQELRAEMGAGAPDIATVVSAVRERLPDLPAPARLDPEQERFRLFDCVTTFLERAAKRRALMLVIDDLHWADAPSLALLQFLAREMGSDRLMVVATYRDEEARPERPLFASLAALTSAPLSRQIALAGLREPDVALLIERAASAKPSAGLIRAVAQQTEGNPFFVGEVVRWLVAQGRLEQAATAAIQVPPSVRQVIGRRLQRLSPQCNELLMSAAVVGRDFPLALLARVCGQAHDALLELAEEAVAARILAEVSDEAGRYAFMHALIRETLYGELSRVRRRRLHRQIAEALESLHATHLDRHLPALAYHFNEAGSPETAERAVTYAQRAGDRALTLTAYEEAVTYYQRVLHALDRAEGADALRRAQVLLALGKAEFGCGKLLAEARQRYLQAATIARQLKAPELLARAALAFATGPRLAGAVDTTRAQLLEEANEALAADETVLHAQVLARLALDLAERAAAPERVAALCDEAVAIARRHDDPDTLAQVLINVASAHWRPETLPTRLAWLKELEALSKRVENKGLIPPLHLLRINTFSLLGDAASFDAAVEAYTSAAEELRVPYFLQVAHHLRATRATLSGRFADAESSAQAAFALCGTVHQEHALQVFGAQLSSLRREQGRLAELEPVISAAVERQPQAVSWRVALALLHAELGHTDAARRELERIEPADVPVGPIAWLLTIGYLAEVTAAVGDTRRAAILADLLQPYANMCVVSADALVCCGAAARHLGLLAATMRRWDDAGRHFDNALAINRALGAPTLVTRTQYSYASMLLARDAPGDRAHAEELVSAAIDTAQQLGMKVLLEHALALKLKVQGRELPDTNSSIDAVATAVATERPDLGPQRAPDGTVTILFSDIESFMALTGRLGDQRAHAVLQAHNRIIRTELTHYAGFEVKSQGDGFMVAFSSARRALLCAIAVQRALAGYAAEHPEEPIRVRVGLHTGEVIKEGEDFFGTTVNLAARIAAQARGGEILVSSVLKELTESAGDLCFGAGRSVHLKGVAGARTLFSVLWAGELTGGDSPAVPAPGTAVLRQEDAFWTLSYDGTTSRLKDVKGLHYLAHLLRHPGREFHALDLVRGPGLGGPGAANPEPATGNAGLAILDATAKAAYRQRLAGLREELAEAERFNDQGRAARARAEIEAISEQLSAAVGLGGRDRATGSAAERARSTVTKRIKEALKRIGETNDPLADHFATRVKTGTFCVYVPDAVHPITWELS